MGHGRAGFGLTGTFWTAASVLVVCLWAASSPSILYPRYAEIWGLTEVVITAAFSAYPAALLLVLLLFGGVSDRIGRKRTMLIGVGFVLLSAIACAFAPNIGWIFVGRALQGIGTGFALSAASASLVENNPSRNSRWASITTTVSTSVGLAVGILVGGAFLGYVQAPLMTSYLVLLAACVPVVVALALSRPDTARPVAGGRSMLPSVPRRLIRVWLAAALACGLGYGLGAIVVSLGADMARDFTGTDDPFLVSALMACAFLCVVVVSLSLGRIPPRVNVIAGVLFAGGALALAILAAATGSLAVFVAWMVVSQLAFAVAFTGGLEMMNRAAPPENRAAALSLVFLVSYLFQGAASLGVGAIATGSDLRTATEIAVVPFGVLGAIVLVLTVWDAVAERRGRAATL